MEGCFSPVFEFLVPFCIELMLTLKCALFLSYVDSVFGLYSVPCCWLLMLNEISFPSKKKNIYMVFTFLHSALSLPTHSSMDSLTIIPSQSTVLHVLGFRTFPTGLFSYFVNVGNDIEPKILNPKFHFSLKHKISWIKLGDYKLNISEVESNVNNKILKR